VRLNSMVCAVSALLLLVASSPARAQTDPRLVDVIRQAQQGQSDSARARVQQLLASTTPTDTLYPQILYTQAMVATDAGSMRRQLQRVAVEYATSSWADDALLRLVQLDFASGNLDGAARNLERIRRDYPGTPLLPQVSYWAARTYFDQKNPGMACHWLADGIAASSGNVEMQNQLGYLNQRCSQVAIDTGTRPSGDTTTSSGAAAADTTTTTLVKPDTTAPPAPVAASKPFRIQVSAVGSSAAAAAMISKLKGRGLVAVTLQEGGLYKVRVGSYATRADATAALPGVKAKLGGNPFVVSGP
jgi:cell division septation protein DedD